MTGHCQLRESQVCVPKQVAFKAFRQFNDPALRHQAGSDYRLNHVSSQLFSSASQPDRLARLIAETHSFRLKELVESFEFFERVRSRVRAPKMADLCCGHGLVGMLFAAFEREVEEVVLFDCRKPKLFTPLFESVCRFAPWVEAKVRFVEARLTQVLSLVAPQSSIVAAHACGLRTDTCLQAAITLKGHVAVLPCCYGQTGSGAPLALRRSLGVTTATDIHRTYLLEQHGYDVSWSAIPSEVSPMNRIISGVLLQNGSTNETDP